MITTYSARPFAAARSGLSLACLAVIAGSAASALAQPFDPPAIPRTLVVQPNPAQPMAPVFGNGADAAIERPNHPPINEIPAMPMPEFNPAGRDSFAGTTSFDAVTGVRTELPVGTPSGLEGASGGGTFVGALANVDTGIEADPSFGTMVAAGALDSWPRSGNVKLVMRFVDQTGVSRFFVASGSMQDSGTVLTAAHCVYARNPSGLNIFNWASEIWVYPAWDGVSDGGPFGAPGGAEVIQNFGWARGTYYVAGTAYVNDGNTDRDIGLIRLGSDTRSVGVLTGWYGWTWGFDCGTAQDRDYSNFSYPAEGCGGGLHTGRTMYFWDGRVDDCPNNQFQLNTTSGCLTAVWGGMSGSGMYWRDSAAGDYRRVHAVCSTSNRSTRGYYCKLWEQFVTDMGTFNNQTRGDTADLQALRYRFNGTDTTFSAGQSLPASTMLVSNATNGDPTAGTYTVRYYISSNNNISTADTLLATYNYNVDFAPMQSMSFGVPAMQIPASLAAGNYWVGAIIDTAADGNSGNNDTDTWDAQPVTITPCIPVRPPATITAGDSVSCDNITVSWAGVIGATSYQLFRNTSNDPATASMINGDASSPFVDTTAASNLTYSYWVKAVNTCGPSDFSASNSGRRLGAPTISAHPRSVVTRQFTDALFSVDPGSGGPFTYQWRRNGVNLTDSARILGSNTFRLTLRGVRTADEGTYDCVITGRCGSTTSRRASLRVLCTADFDDGSGTGTPDDAVTLDDLLYYMNQYDAGSIAADVDDGSGRGSVDGAVTVDDLLFFMERYERGC
jgi:hypothetical protein